MAPDYGEGRGRVVIISTPSGTSTFAQMYFNHFNREPNWKGFGRVDEFNLYESPPLPQHKPERVDRPWYRMGEKHNGK